MTTGRWLGLSILLHAVFFVAFEPVHHEQVYVGISYKAAKTPPLKTTETKRASGRRQGHSHSTSLKSLLPKSYLSTWQQVRNSVPSETWADPETFRLNEMQKYSGLTTSDARFNTVLWRQIDQSIFNSPHLSEYGHVGVVYFQFSIEAGTHLTGIKARAKDKVLKVLAARAIRKALKNETGELPALEKAKDFNAQFVWAAAKDCESQRGWIGNNLSFCHVAEDKRRKYTAGQKIGNAIGAIMQHGPWGIEEIQKYRKEEIRHKSNFDPFEEMQHDPDWNLGPG